VHFRGANIALSGYKHCTSEEHIMYFKRRTIYFSWNTIATHFHGTLTVSHSSVRERRLHVHWIKFTLCSYGWQMIIITSKNTILWSSSLIICIYVVRVLLCGAKKDRKSFNCVRRNPKSYFCQNCARYIIKSVGVLDFAV
jgi:hypothetical protein